VLASGDSCDGHLNVDYYSISRCRTYYLNGCRRGPPGIWPGRGGSEGPGASAAQVGGDKGQRRQLIGGPRSLRHRTERGPARFPAEGAESTRPGTSMRRSGRRSPSNRSAWGPVRHPGGEGRAIRLQNGARSQGNVDLRTTNMTFKRREVRGLVSTPACCRGEAGHAEKPGAEAGAEAVPRAGTPKPGPKRREWPGRTGCSSLAEQRGAIPCGPGHHRARAAAESGTPEGGLVAVKFLQHTSRPMNPSAPMWGRRDGPEQGASAADKKRETRATTSGRALDGRQLVTSGPRLGFAAARAARPRAQGRWARLGPPLPAGQRRRTETASRSGGWNAGRIGQAYSRGRADREARRVVLELPADLRPGSRTGPRLYKAAQAGFTARKPGEGQGQAEGTPGGEDGGQDRAQGPREGGARGRIRKGP